MVPSRRSMVLEVFGWVLRVVGGDFWVVGGHRVGLQAVKGMGKWFFHCRGGCTCQNGVKL